MKQRTLPEFWMCSLLLKDYVEIDNQQTTLIDLSRFVAIDRPGHRFTRETFALNSVNSLQCKSWDIVAFCGLSAVPCLELWASMSLQRAPRCDFQENV